MGINTDRTASALPRVLGPWMTTAIVIGCIIGSGVFKKPAAVADKIPEFLPAMGVWVLGGMLALIGSLVLAEVAVLFPRTGGNYVFLREGYGRAFGFLWGWVEFWIIRSGSIAALATIFTESLCELLQYGVIPEGQQIAFWPRQAMTVSVILGLAAVNVRGVNWGGTLQVILTTVKISSLIGIAVLPFIAGTEGKPAPITTAAPSWGITHFGLALIGVIWAYHGWMNIGPIAGEVSRPNRNIPFGLLLGVGVVILLYLSANYAYHQAMTQEEMKNLPKTTSVLAECGRRWLGPIGGAVAAAVIMASVFGALNGNIMVGPRLLFAMGEDGLAPAAMQQIHPKFKTPAVAILAMSGWSALMVVIVAIALQLAGSVDSKSAFDSITDFAMFGAVCFETLAVLSIFAFRYKLPNVERPYRCPFYPVLPALYGVLLAGVIASYFIQKDKRSEAVSGIVTIAIGVVVYAVFLRRRKS
jgi:APA family basic amino acid/polyamine antiporter